jgi:hypothetical protein
MKVTCAHVDCECEIDESGSGYCSSICEQDAEEPTREHESLGCRCGHSGCGGEGIPMEEDLEQRA